MDATTPSGESFTNGPPFAAEAEDSTEPNDSFDLAAPVAAGIDVREVISDTNDVDYFVFSIDLPGTSISATLTNLPADYALHRYVQARPIAFSDRPGLSSESIGVSSVFTGSYYLKVDSPEGGSAIKRTCC